MSSLESLQKENEILKESVDNLRKRLSAFEEGTRKNPSFLTVKTPGVTSDPISVVVVGASGDLSKKKTFPALFQLYLHNLLPQNVTIFGYARSKYTDEEFRVFCSQNFKGPEDKKKDFLQRVFYHVGQYEDEKDFAEVSKKLELTEKGKGNRIFYLAIPPSIFYPVAKCIRAAACAPKGWTRVVVEKPFGKDLQSSNELSIQLGSLFTEDEIYRIDHYLGKEMVQNLMGLRFANSVFEPLWNKFQIRNVQITFKEDIGTEGRGGYFDEFGIIRDVMQNHLCQIFALVAMEPPVTLSAEDVRDEKVKLLRSVPPIVPENIVIGQYTKSADGSKEGYLDDPTVPKGSLCPTFATAVLYVNNSRWEGVPFILKCGKALNERKAEIRIQFQPPPGYLYDNPPPNELILRIQPNEAIYLKMSAKSPGLSDGIIQMELDLTYNKRFEVSLPDAYERLILDVIRGDHNLFVRNDELAAAWTVFTPILHYLEENKVKPINYEFGTRGPDESDELVKKCGYIRTPGYVWKPDTQPKPAAKI